MGHHHHQQRNQVHNLLSFHFQLPNMVGLGRRAISSSSSSSEEEDMMMAPKKGWMGIRVGGEGEELKRFMVPVEYLNHPLFLSLLKVAEEEYGFDHKGAITIPCHVEDFTRVKGIIDRDHTHSHHHHHHQQHHHHHHHHHHLVGCFKA
ncbi:hypothetical protein J5N97_025372 [Dioscorea zingiberensis]|uniref:Uncharacterized protein n=1 Tax=Dioscorea zingiberensis TaxID=325984 RepID=A0A9D5C9P4_9LILI|nr:hypothetical protein J5N97_025372 [Dioscorea zingiberensis]